MASLQWRHSNAEDCGGCSRLFFSILYSRKEWCRARKKNMTKTELPQGQMVLWIWAHRNITRREEASHWCVLAEKFECWMYSKYTLYAHVYVDANRSILLHNLDIPHIPHDCHWWFLLFVWWWFEWMWEALLPLACTVQSKSPRPLLLFDPETNAINQT